jgi:glutamate/tyrosine decarboxylase-like PLP-dependent enzyme
MADGFPDNRLPAHGADADAVLARMGELRSDDRDWKGGRVFSLVYSAGDAVHDLLQQASNLYSAENALNTMVFPSLGWMQHDIVTITAGLLGADQVAGDGNAGGGSEVRGYLTSGGTESLLQATKTARDWGRGQDRPVQHPNMVLATSAHAAFEKAAHYFDVESRRIAVGADYRADTDAMADAIDDETVMVVGSAPSYPQGVIDPIPDLASLAAERGILCHVDACLGGFILPFLGQLGHVTRQWDLSVRGVTSISADLHKYGYASKGVSVVLYSSRELARLQPFITANWLGGLYGSPSMAGTRPAGPIAAGWAVLHYLGNDGYLRLAGDTWRAAATIRDAIDRAPGLAVRGDPDATVFAFGGEAAGGPGGATSAIDTFALGDRLADRGDWYFDRQ